MVTQSCHGRRVGGPLGLATAVLAGIALALVLALGPASAGGPATTWTGLWKDRGEPNGIMKLTQSGNRVTGTWEPTNIMPPPWRVQGTVRGKSFTGTYSYMAGDPQVMQGPFKLTFTMTDDGRYINGVEYGASPDFRLQKQFERGSMPPSYTMPARFGLKDDRGMIRYSAAKPNPPKWPVQFTQPGCDQAKLAGFAWQVDGKTAASKVVAGKQCTVEVDVRTLGKHHITASSSGSPQFETDMVARDFLIVGLGDSVASGEGNPDVGAAAGGPLWQEPRCDRSAKSFEAQAALMVEQNDEQTSVSFVHVACSGAAIRTGVTGPYWGISPGDASMPLASQIGSLPKLVRGRAIDAVIVSIGANDLGFGDVLVFCVKWTSCPVKTYEGGKPLQQVIAERLTRLPALYAELAQRLQPVVPANRVYINLYPDELHDASGNLCDNIIEGRITGVRADEARWMYDSFMTPLNAAIEKAAAAHGWNVINGGPALFRNHGYCAGKQGWVVTYDQSEANQGDANGTMHPNEEGHKQMASYVGGRLIRDLWPGGKPRP